MHKGLLKTGIAFAGLAVIFGAFGAHSLKEKLSAEALAVFETSVRYQVYHAFALIACGILAASFDNARLRRAAGFFGAGIILFSGSLYAITALHMSGYEVPFLVGILTPLGGLCFIMGWALLFFAVSAKKIS